MSCPGLKAPAGIRVAGMAETVIISRSAAGRQGLLFYFTGNVRVISQLANVMLNKASREQRIALARWVLQNETH